MTLLLLCSGAYARDWAVSGNVLERALPALARRFGVQIDPGRITGGPIAGFTVRGARVSAPHAEILIEELEVKIDWRALLGRSVKIERLRLARARVRLRQAPPKKAADKPAAAGPKQLPIEIGRLEVQDLSIERAGGFGPLKKIEGLDLIAVVLAGEVRILSLRAPVPGSVLSARGRVLIDPFAASLLIESEGELSGSLQAAMGARGWSAGGRLKAAPGRGVVGRLVAPAKRAAPITLRVQARGDSRQPIEGSAQARIDAVFGKAGRAVGRLSLARGEARALWELRGDLEGDVDARLALQSQTGRAEWTLALSSAAAAEWSIRVPGNAAFEGEFRGGAQRHALSAAVSVGERTIELDGEGSLADGIWRARWSRARIDAGETWTALGPFTTFAGRGAYRLEDLELASSRGQAKADLSWRAPSQGRARVTLSTVTAMGLGPGTLELDAALAGGVVRIATCAWSSPQGAAFLSGTIPMKKGKGPIPDFSARLRTDGFDVSSLASGWFTASEGSLKADLKLTNRGGVFDSRGQASLSASAISSERAGVSFEDFLLRIEGQGDAFRVVEARARSGRKGSVSIEGLVAARGPDLKMNARHLRLAPRETLSAVIDGELSVRGRWLEPFFEGELVVERASYLKEKKKKRRFWSRKKPEPPRPRRAPRPWGADVRVRFDRGVWYKEDTTSVELKGDLRLRKAGYERLQLFGPVETVRGRVAYHGREFEVQRGRVEFIGDMMRSPVDILGLYTDFRSNTKIFLQAEGELGKPRITLRSEPPMEERDIISILAIGRPLDEQSAGAPKESDDAAREAAERMFSNYLATKFRQTALKKLDLDIFRVRMEENHPSEVAVGRYLTKDLFVTYERSFGSSTQSRIRSEYAITPKWSLEGTNNAAGQYVIDLFFRRGFR